MSTAPAFSPGPLQHARAFGRQRLQMHARALVAAVLRPHHREQAELGQIRLAADQLDDPRVLVGVMPCRSSVRAIEGRVISAQPPATTPRFDRRFDDGLEQDRPSALPSAVSHARSGCGIRPTTLRRVVADAGDVARAIRSDWPRRSSRPTRSRSGTRSGRTPRARASVVGRRVVVAFAVGDRQAQHLAGRRSARERRVGALDAHADELAVKLQVAIAQHRAGQQAALEQNLEPVADAEHRPARRRRTPPRRS